MCEGFSLRNAMDYEKIYYVDEDDAEERIDKYLVDYETEHSRTYLQKLIADGNVTVNGKTVKSNYRLSEGECIRFLLPEPEPLNILPENIPLDIVYEDGDIIVINKPKNMVVHPAPGHLSGTLVNALLYHCRDGLSGINGVLRPGIVHRIDKDTTGILIACKTDTAHKCIAEQIKQHSGKRIYHAIVHGCFREKEGRVDAPIGRSPVDRKKMAINEKNGKPAITNYTVLETLNDKYSYIECRLETGRTHQIRVHLASLHHPLLGDTFYGNGKDSLFETNGQVLHAALLGIKHPRTGEYMEFTADEPEYFKTLLSKLREPARVKRKEAWLESNSI